MTYLFMRIVSVVGGLINAGTCSSYCTSLTSLLPTASEPRNSEIESRIGVQKISIGVHLEQSTSRSARSHFTVQ